MSGESAREYGMSIAGAVEGREGGTHEGQHQAHLALQHAEALQHRLVRGLAQPARLRDQLACM